MSASTATVIDADDEGVFRFPAGERGLFSVLSYNLLAECYVRVPNQPWNSFSYVSDDDLAWADKRQPAIARQLAESGADIVCLQEVVMEQRCRDGSGAATWQLPAWMDAFEELGYTCLPLGLKQRDWDNNAKRNLRAVGRATPTGLAVLYRASRFRELAVSQHGAGSGIVVFLGFVDDDDQHTIAVATTHLVGDPAKFDMHLRQLAGLRDKMAKFPTRHRLIMGDFNQDVASGDDTPPTEVQRWFADNGFARSPTPHSFSNKENALRLDHVMHTADLHVRAVLGGMSSAEQQAGLPSRRWPSDHIPVGVLFSI